MDALADLLDGARARGALFSRAIMRPPWSLRFVGGAPLTLLTMARGRGWVVPAEGEPVQVGTCDIAIVRGPGPYTVADHPAVPPQYTVHRADRCTRADGTEVGDDLTLGPRTCGEDPEGPDLLLTGAYEVGGEISRRLLSALPGVLVVSNEDYPCAAMDLVAEEVARERPGQQVVLDRLLDLVLISTLRSWFDRPDTHTPAWYSAMGDPVVGRALRLLHDRPARPWTVAGLAAECGVSRAALARRFTALVGEPPMAYLADWRIVLAADLLRGTDATVGSIARKVGYADAFALSVAFKRLRGVAPTEYRRALAGGTPRPQDALSGPPATGPAAAEAVPTAADVSA